MAEAIRRNTTLLVGMAVCGLLLLAARPCLLTSRGAIGPSVLQAQSAALAAVAVVVAFGLATAVAIVVGRVINAVVGLFALGSGVFVLAIGLDTTREIALLGASLHVVAIETLLTAGLLLVASLAMFRVAGPLPDVYPRERGASSEPWWGRSGLIAGAAGVLVLPAVWLIAHSAMRGQVIGAVFVGSAVAGLVGRLLSPHVQPVVLFATPALFGGLSQMVVASMIHGPLDTAFMSGSFPALGLPMPIDYAAGSLMGVAVGLGWARSFLHHEEAEG
jgi:hypothetical protein